MARKHILILSGPTHEYIDPVRFIGNASSGLMGRSIAEEAEKRGFTVEFISGPVCRANLPVASDSIRVHPVVSAEEMLETAKPLFQKASAIVFAAAVADYTPIEKRAEKMAKSSDELILRLRPTPDIARTLCSKKAPDQVAIGFALQTNEGEMNARRKLTGKYLDGIVLNTPASLGALTGTFSFLGSDQETFETWGCIEKELCAKHILDIVQSRLN
ncbi:MAG: phosphopantothenoylcysteine decarboxylase [Pontiellaceae bacterium]|nr:phosphopantothenoylcysteine decarboxylase [Pontiellaceae bacterium]MBN2786027.1 phosphopantothenoylcysteine decarboxylase [Pontiellaceae bacterium]